MPRLDLRRLQTLLDRFADQQVLVVGDVMLDEYLWGDVERVNPEAPVPVVHVRSESIALGGAGNVARNVVAMGARCSFCGVVGEDGAGDSVADLLKDLGVSPLGLVRDPSRPTTRKTRIEARSQQMLRFDRETEEPIERPVARELLNAVEAAIPGSQGVILEDYGKGLLAPAVVRDAMRRFASHGLPVAVDPKHLVAPFRGAALFKPNQREVEALCGGRVRSDADLARFVGRMQRSLGGSDVVVTRAADGMSLFEQDAAEPVHVPVARSEVFDNQGAGDTCIAVLALGRLAGGSLLESALLATAAAGVVVGKVGTATASPEEIRGLLPAALDAVRLRQKQGRRS